MPKNGEPVHRPSEGVLRASEAELVVGAVEKHSRRMEYPKYLKIFQESRSHLLPVLIMVGGQILKQLSEVQNTSCTQPAIHWTLHDTSFG